jgi:hypothetical protein
MSHHDPSATNGQHSPEHHSESSHHDHEAVFPPSGAQANDENGSDIVGKAATIAVVGVGVALISAELIPGMLIGVAAAFLPGIGPKLRPFFKSTVRAGYSAFRKTREMVSEAGEQIQDVIAEVNTEHTHPAPPPPSAPHV